MAKSQILTSSGEDKGMEQQEHSSAASGNARWHIYFGKQKDSFLPSLRQGGGGCRCGSHGRQENELQREENGDSIQHDLVYQTGSNFDRESNASLLQAHLNPVEFGVSFQVILTPGTLSIKLNA